MYNLFSFKNKTIIFNDLPSVIIGPNNSGKSNVFRAIQLLLNELDNSKMNKSYFFDETIDPILTIRLHLNRLELSSIIDFLLYYYYKSKPQFLEYNDFLYTLLNDITIQISWKETSNSIILNKFLIIFEKLKLSLYYFLEPNKHPWNLLYKNKKYRLSFSFIEFLAKLGSMDEYNANIINELQQSNTHNDLFGGFDTTYPYFIEKNQANRIKNFIQYFSFYEISGGIDPLRLLSKLLRHHIIFKSQSNINEKEKIETHSRLFDDGSNLTRYLFSLKMSDNLIERELFQEIQKNFNNIFPDLQFDVIYDFETDSEEAKKQLDKRKEKSISITIIDKRLKRQYTTSQCGTGIIEVLFLLSLYRNINESIIFMDEPANNLHRPLLKSIFKNMFSRYSNINTNNQFIIITHSEQLAHQLIFELNASIYYIKKNNDNESEIYSIKEIETLRQKLEYVIDIRIFFSTLVILLEGESDYYVMSYALKHLQSKESNKFDFDRHDISIIFINGVNNFVNYWRIIKELNIKEIFIADKNKIQGKSIQTIFSQYSTISNNSISGLIDNRYIFDYDDINELLKDIDSKMYDESKQEVNNEFPSRGESKPLIVKRFMQKMINDPQADIKMKVFKDLFTRINNVAMK
jgi:predicted ATPase